MTAYISSRSACSAPEALIVCRIAMMSRGPTPSALSPSTSSWRLTPSDMTTNWRSSPVSISISVMSLHRHRACAVGGERAGLGHLRRLGNPDGEIALGDGDGRDPDMFAHDDGPGDFVDDDAGDLIRLDAQLFDVGHQIDQVVAIALGNRDAHGARIDRLGRGAPEHGVDRDADAPRGGEIGIAQRDRYPVQVGEFEADFTLDDRAVGDPPSGRHALGDAGAAAAGRRPKIRLPIPGPGQPHRPRRRRRARG